MSLTNGLVSKSGFIKQFKTTALRILFVKCYKTKIFNFVISNENGSAVFESSTKELKSYPDTYNLIFSIELRMSESKILGSRLDILKL